MLITVGTDRDANQEYQSTLNCASVWYTWSHWALSRTLKTMDFAWVQLFYLLILFLFLFSSLITILFLRSCRHHGATYIFQFFFFEIFLLPFILHVSNWGQISLGVKEILYLQRLSWNRKTEIQKCEFKLLPYKSINLQCTVVYHATYQINYFLEMHWYCAALDILMVFRVVYQLRNFLCSNHFWAVTEYKQHSINDIGFSTAVGANNGREVLKNKMITTDIWESFNLYTTYMYCVNWVFRVLIGY